MNRRQYRTLIYIAIVLTIGWISWGIYDSFFLSRTPGDAEYHAANKFFEDGAYERALNSYDDALQLNSSNIHALRGKARSLMQLGKENEALDTFNEAIAIEPEFGGTYANRGILFDRMGEYELALQDYQTALNIDPDIAEGPHWLIRFLRNQPERPPGILERANYIALELRKPEAERLLQLSEIDEKQRSYKK